MSDDPRRPVPSLSEILDWLEGRLEPTRRDAVGAALAEAEAVDDRPTIDLVTWLRQLRLDAGRLPLVAPPPLLAQRLRAIPRARAGRALIRVDAKPTLDSRRSARPAGVRGAPDDPDSARFQLGFQAPQAAVVVDVTANADETVTVRGQVIPIMDTPRVFTATFEGSSGTVHADRTDHSGGFRLERVPLDVRTLVVTNDEIEISMPLDLFPGLR